ncbi:C40 family peptidase [Leptolyngbya sp. Cla-17]|uniref:C40 family peptidase n=1 Tax=Leptolyngbya sp. Cla-17 TaxID=2803751 RepID=UPI0018DA23FD|nr:C40 family peptidase [Leptolyngbya sp. Cla-17]
MISLQANQVHTAEIQSEYRCSRSLDVFDSPALERLATQAAVGRHLRTSTVLEQLAADQSTAAIAVCLCEDDYPGWISMADLAYLEKAVHPYQPISLSTTEIQARVPAAIAFTQAAKDQPNHYLWGGTVAPNYDCSGLMQAAFASVGVWLPRDAYQQEAFTQAIAVSELQPGDLIFFGTPQKATHVGLYLGDNHYIHSSGKDQGHNGIAIDVLSDQASRIGQTYYAQLRGAGRIVATYQPSQTL